MFSGEEIESSGIESQPLSQELTCSNEGRVASLLKMSDKIWDNRGAM